MSRRGELVGEFFRLYERAIDRLLSLLTEFDFVAAKIDVALRHQLS